MSDIKDISLAPSGHKKIEWVQGYMPLLNTILRGFFQNQAAVWQKRAGLRACGGENRLPCQTLAAAGANVCVTGCNPLSTQDDVAAALVEDGLTVFTRHGESMEEYEKHLKLAISTRPDVFIDDGGDILDLLMGEMKSYAQNVIGGTEETTTGVIRLKAKEASLPFPMLAVNDAQCKYLFDNRYGTGQSVWNAINKTTNLIVAGKTVVVAGYGWCGKGCAMRAKGLGAKVVVTEVDPIKAIEAVMDGHTVLPMAEAAKIGDIFVTLTGCERVIYKEHFEVMKDGAILCNAGHFDVEICIPELAALASEVREVRENIKAYMMPDGRRINLLADGRLVNLASGDGHPAEIMDMSFAIQALSVKYMAENGGNMAAKVHQVPADIDRYVANLKLSTLGIAIDKLSDAQKAYLSKAAIQ